MKLSPRLREVVELIGGRGLPYKAVARKLGVSPRTVEEYAAEIRARSGLAMNPRQAMREIYDRMTEKPKPRKGRKKAAA